MKKIFSTLFILFIFISITKAQIVDTLWYCAYATWDHPDANATGYNTPSVGVFSENTFVALINRPANNTAYVVAYKNADSSNGRIGSYGYGSSGIGGYRQQWVSGFDVVEMLRPWDLAVAFDSLIFVANNDTIDRNILVLKVGTDSVYTTDFRMSTGDSNPIFGIDLDQSGKVYVTKEGDGTTTPGKVLVFPSINDDPNWGFLHTTTPLQTITLPEVGFIRGVTVNKEGTLMYVSNYTNGKVYCYTGNPMTGYTLYPGFNFTINDSVAGQPTLKPGPLGMKFMPTKNLLFVASAYFYSTSAYSYGRIYILNPNTGEVLGKVDAAEWNFKKTGAYNSRGDDGKQGDVSGYTSPFGVDVDNDFNLYSVSYYGWTVDKWVYNGTLPTIPIVILSVERTEGIPESFSLAQNYPNPFNPTTTIEFSLNESGTVELMLYNILGEKIAELISKSYFERGNYKMTFDASKLKSGNYFYTLKLNNNPITKKMSLIK